MDITQEDYFRIFGALLMLFGAFGVLRGKMTVGFQGTGKYDRIVVGATAKWLSVGMAGAGALFFIGPAVGFGAALAVFVVAWLLGEPIA